MKHFRLIVAVIVLAGLVSTGGLSAASSGLQASKQPARATRISAAALLKKFSSNSGEGTQVRVTTNGNIVGFASPTVMNEDLDHIDAGIVTEGYVVCYKDPNTLSQVNDYDVYSSKLGFGPATTTATPLTVTRKTKGGLLQLTQTFTFNGPERALTVVMALKNISGTTISGISMRRQVDIDADAGGPSGTGTYDNIFGATQGSVFGYDDGGGSILVAPPGQHGLMVRSLATSLGSQKGGGLTGAATSSTADTGCSLGIDPTPTTPKDDGASFIFRPGPSLAPGETLTETFQFEAF